MTRFLTCLPFSLNVEAGFQNRRDDAGNWSSGVIGSGRLIGTNRGITPTTLARFHGIPVDAITEADMRALTAPDATAIYAALFWNRIRGDCLGAGIDLSTMDMEINAGAFGSMCLQRALGLTGGDVDGWIGARTLAALDRVDAAATARGLAHDAAAALQGALGLTADGAVGPKTLAALAGAGGRACTVLGAAYGAQMAHYRQAPRWPTYGRGWTARCGARLALAVKMATGGAVMS